MCCPFLSVSDKFSLQRSEYNQDTSVHRCIHSRPPTVIDRIRHNHGSGAFPNVPGGSPILWVSRRASCSGDAGRFTSSSNAWDVATCAPVPPVAQAMCNAELTTIIQQVTAQMASDHVWFGIVHDDISDHASRLDKLSMISLTNKVKLDAVTEESKKAFALIDASDGLIKSIVSQVTDKTSEHDRLL